MKKAIIFFCSVSLSCFGSNSDDTAKKYVEIRQESFPTDEIFPEDVGEVVCVDRIFNDGKKQEIQPECSFVLKYRRVHFVYKFGVIEKGWLWNTEDKLPREKIELSESSVVKYKGQMYTRNIPSLLGLVTGDTNTALAAADDAMSSMIAAGDIVDDRKAQKAMCENQRDFMAGQRGKWITIPNDMSRRLY